MEGQERERWEQFYRTGLICDYLRYRGVADRRPADPDREESVDADNTHRDQGGGALG